MFGPRGRGRIERFWPGAAGLVAGATAWAALPDPAMFRAATQLPGLLVNISSISFGFLATVRGILVSAHDRPFLAKFREQRPHQYHRFMGFLNNTIIAALLLVVFSLVAAVWDVSLPLGTGERVLLAFLLGFAAYTFGATFRTVHLNAKLLYFLDDDGQARPQA